MGHKTEVLTGLVCKICKRPYDNTRKQDFAVIDGIIACFKHKGVKELFDENGKSKLRTAVNVSESNESSRVSSEATS